MKQSNVITVIVLVLLIGIGGWAATMHTHSEPPSATALPTICQVPDFTMTDQDGHTVKRADLLGHPFILDFIFTMCTEYCSDMTNTLGKIRTTLGPDTEVRTVSITVDPEHDTPAILKHFAATHHAIDPKWLFLTGTKRTIGTIQQKLFLAPPNDNPAMLSPSQHSPRLILVDAQGNVRGFYMHDDLDARQRLAADAHALEAQSNH